MSNLSEPGDNSGYYGEPIYSVFDTIENYRYIWMRHDRYQRLVSELNSIKFTVQIERDKIPAIIEKYSIDEPFSETNRFRNGRWYAIPDGQIYLSRMVNASYFKNRADEVNRGRGNATNTPSSVDNSGSDGSKLQEDLQAPQDLRDATTQFFRSLLDFQRINKIIYYIVKFERENGVIWHNSPNVLGYVPPASSSKGYTASAIAVAASTSATQLPGVATPTSSVTTNAGSGGTGTGA